MEFYKETRTNIDLNKLDRQLVQKESLRFVSNNSEKRFNLTDDGLLEVYHNNNTISSTLPFSRINVITEGKKLIDEGYQLVESELKLPDLSDGEIYSVEIISNNIDNPNFISAGKYTSKQAAIEAYSHYINKDSITDCRIVVDKVYTEAEIKTTNASNTDTTNVDLEKEKENIEQTKEQVEEIRKEKEELQDEINELIEESYEINNVDDEEKFFENLKSKVESTGWECKVNNPKFCTKLELNKQVEDKNLNYKFAVHPYKIEALVEKLVSLPECDDIDDTEKEEFTKLSECLKNIKVETKLVETGYSRLYSHIKGDNNFAIIGSQDKDTKEDRSKELTDMIRRLSYKKSGVGYNKVDGAYKYDVQEVADELGGKAETELDNIAHEKSIIVFNLDKNDALNIGNALNQESVIWHDSDFFGTLYSTGENEGKPQYVFDNRDMSFSGAEENEFGTRLKSDKNSRYGVMFEGTLIEPHSYSAKGYGTTYKKIEDLKTKFEFYGRKYEEKSNEFPSTEVTSKELTPRELREFDVNLLTQDQKEYINNSNKFGSLTDFKIALEEFSNFIIIDENIPLISIDEYIKNIEEKENNK